MNAQHEYSLQKYAGRATRHTCPQCGQFRCFSLYVDESGNPLHETVGRCDHESSCGYHKTPKEYFDEHPSLKQDWREPSIPKAKVIKTQSIKQKPLCTIPTEYLNRSVRPDIPSTFTAFLLTLFPEETVISLTKRYNLGVTRPRDVIYYQVETNGKVRTGKIMKYNPRTGKRIKDSDTPFKINWVHSVMKHSGQLPQDWELTQCLFGEHLLSDPNEKHKTVALVESEKSAIIASAIMPKYIWLATGGKSQLKPEKLEALKGRNIIAFPDVDGYKEWKEKLPSIEGLTITVSDVLERRATDHERYAHIDIADWLIRWRTETIKKFGTLEPIPLAVPACPVPGLVPGQYEDLGHYDNPNFQQVATFFSPEAWPELSLLINDLDLIPRTLLPADPI